MGMNVDWERVPSATFDDEGMLSDVFARAAVGAQSTYDHLKGLLETHPVIIIKVPGQPDRALVKRKSLGGFGGAGGPDDPVLVPFG